MAAIKSAVSNGEEPWREYVLIETGFRPESAGGT
jgi:hypothetical protein